MKRTEWMSLQPGHMIESRKGAVYTVVENDCGHVTIDPPTKKKRSVLFPQHAEDFKAAQ